MEASPEFPHRFSLEIKRNTNVSNKRIAAIFYFITPYLLI
jgi:hypothetical protein